MAPDLRALRPDEREGALTLLMRVFGQAPAAEDVEVELAVVDPQRFYGAFEGDRLVGAAGSLALTTTASWAPSWPASSRTSTRPTQRWRSPGRRLPSSGPPGGVERVEPAAALLAPAYAGASSSPSRCTSAWST